MSRQIPFQQNNSTMVAMNRSILRSAFGNIIQSASKTSTTPYHLVNNTNNHKFVNDSSNYTRFKKLQSQNREYKDT